MEEEKKKFFVMYEGEQLPTMYFLDIERYWRSLHNREVNMKLAVAITLSVMNTVALIALWIIAI